MQMCSNLLKARGTYNPHLVEVAMYDVPANDGSGPTGDTVAQAGQMAQGLSQSRRELEDSVTYIRLTWSLRDLLWSPW